MLIISYFLILKQNIKLILLVFAALFISEPYENAGNFNLLPDELVAIILFCCDRHPDEWETVQC